MADCRIDIGKQYDNLSEEQKNILAAEAEYRYKNRDKTKGSKIAEEKFKREIMHLEKVKTLMQDLEIAEKIAIDSGKKFDAGKTILNFLEDDNSYAPGSRDTWSGHLQTVKLDAVRKIESAMEMDSVIINKLMGNSEDTRLLSKDMSREYAQLTKLDSSESKLGYTGNEDAKKIAKIFNDNIKYWQQALADNGVDIKLLDSYARKQKHDRKILHKEGLLNWKKFMLDENSGNLDVERTFGPDIDRAELDSRLDEIFSRITNNLSSVESNQIFDVATSLKRQRFLHFKDVEAELRYNDRFNKEENFFTQMVDMVQKYAATAETIGRFGLNPKKAIKDVVNIAGRKYPTSELKMGDGFSGVGTKAKRIVDAYKVISGENNIADSDKASQFIAKTGKLLRNITDMATMANITKNSLSDIGISKISDNLEGMTGSVMEQMNQALRSIPGVKKNSPEMKRYLKSMLIGYEGIVSDVSRRFNEGGIRSIGDKITKLFWKGTFIDKFTSAQESGIALANSHYMAQESSFNFDQLRPIRRKFYEKYGYGETSYNLMKKYGITEIEGRKLIDPDFVDRIPSSEITRILENEKKIYGHTYKIEESHIRNYKRKLQTTTSNIFRDVAAMGINRTSDTTKRILQFGTKTGTIPGEIVRTATKFKPYMWEISQNLHTRIWNNPSLDVYGKAKAVVGGMVYGYAMAYAVVALKELIKGNTLPDPSSKRNITEVLSTMAVGGLGGEIFMSFIDGAENKYGQDSGLLNAIIGPTFSKMWGMAKDTGSFVFGDSKGKHDPKPLIKDLVRTVPYNNSTLVDRLFTQPLIGMLEDPKANDRRRKRKEKNRAENSGFLWDQKAL